jgi:heme-degrading monooxygenase HmoA
MAESSSHVVTIFRNRLLAGAEADYASVAPRISELASQMNGFIDAKTFVAADGERVTIVTFADQASHNAWRDHSEHRDVQQRGIAEFYSEYFIQVGTVTYSNHFVKTEQL